MSSIVLYHSPYSPFSRSVLLFMRYLDVDVEIKILDLLEGQQMSAEFMRINPQHCVPTIKENDFVLWESRAILDYLAETRAAHLVPVSARERAILNQRLHFELGGLAIKYASIYVSCKFIRA